MPIAERKRGTILSTRSATPLPVTRDLDTVDVVGDFLAQDNFVYNVTSKISNSLVRDFRPLEGYNVKEDVEGYEGYFDRFRDARNPEETAYIKSKIDRELEQRQNYADATGLQKFLSIGALAVTDPTMLIPVGGAAYKTYRTGGKILEGGVRTAGIAAAIETGREAGLQLSQETRTAQESINNVAAAGFVGFALGSGGTLLNKAQTDELAKRFESEMITPVDVPDGSVGAAAAGSRGGFATTIEQEGIKGLDKTQKFFSGKGSTRLQNIIEDEAAPEWLRNTAKVGQNFAKVPGFLSNPVIEGSVSSSKFVRQITEQLADTSLIKNKNTQFIASEQSVESMIKSYDTLRVPFDDEFKGAYDAYRARISQEKQQGTFDAIKDKVGLRADGVMSYHEFAEEAGKAARRNDTHSIPEVAQAAQAARKHVFDPILKRSEEVGIFKDIDDLDVKTADSWLKRVYNIDKITKQRTVFKERVLNYLKRQRDEARFNVEDFAPIQKQLDELDDLNKALRDAKISPEITSIKNQIDDVAKKKNRTKDTGKKLTALERRLKDLEDGKAKKIKDLEARIAKLSSGFEETPEDLKKILADARKQNLRADKLDVELDGTAEEIIDRITNATQGRLPYDNVIREGSSFKAKPNLRGSAKKRVFNIPDEEIEDFLVSDINEIVNSHIRTMGPDNELLSKFGTLDFDVVKKQIQEEYQVLRNQAKGNNKKLARLDKEMGRDIKNTQAMWEKLRGQFAQPDDYSAPNHLAERGAMALNYVRFLGGVVISSLPDMARPMMVHGFNRTYGKMFKSMMSDMKGWKLAAKEMRELGLMLDMTNSMTALKRANMDEYVGATGRIDQGLQNLSNVGTNLFGINIWNSTMKTFSGIATQDRMLEAIQSFAKGKKIPTKEIENLASHGIGREMAIEIAEQFAKHGEVRDVLRIANARTWDNVAARNTFRNAVRKQVDEIIVTPGLDKPLWLSRPGWRMIGQFKSFSFGSMQRVSLAGLQQADAHVMSGLTAMVMLGSATYAIKTQIAGRSVSDDPRVWIQEGIDRSGITGYLFDVNNIIEKATRGRVGVNALTGGPVLSRYASRNVGGALLGPSFGLTQDIFQTTGAAATGEWTESDVHAARRLIPFQNVPYLRGIFDQLEDSANNIAGGN